MTDQEIVDSISSRDPRSVDTAIEAVYETFYQDIKHYAERNGFDEDDIEDVFQETVMSFVQNIWHGRYASNNQSALKSYIFGIARHKMLKRIRENTRRSEREYVYANHLGVVDIFSQEQDNRLDYIKSAFEQLGETCQKILRAFYFDNMSMQEIAAIFNLGDPNAVKLRKYRCIVKLRTIIQDGKASG